MDLKSKIEEKIKRMVRNAGTITDYREPLVGFASADDNLFTQMQEIIGPHHLHPREMLPEAETVIAFFLPFAKKVVKANRKGPEAAREWAVAYIETNRLIGQISAKLMEELSQEGIKAVSENATHNFNEEDLTAGWSHKSAAYVAGLGTFGVHRMLITPVGCAGRFGSIVTSARISPAPRPPAEFCLYRRKGKCLFCVENCPAGALKVQDLDKQKCYHRLLETDARFPDLGLCDVCGKCAVGPCALGSY